MHESPDRRIFYAIGDVHGEAERLAALHAAIFAHHAAVFPGRPKMLVHLGDYVDRGPDSCGVVETLMALERRAAAEAGLDVVCLKGNHEQMMIDGLHGSAFDEAFWARNGGREAIESYERAGRAELMRRHADWLAARPARYWAPRAGLVFVHAGLSPNRFPHEEETIYLWTRSETFFETAHWSAPALAGQRVVHGHTPTEGFTPHITADGRRINVDTGACWGGPLTAAVIDPDEREIGFLAV